MPLHEIVQQELINNAHIIKILQILAETSTSGEDIEKALLLAINRGINSKQHWQLAKAILQYIKIPPPSALILLKEIHSHVSLTEEFKGEIVNAIKKINEPILIEDFQFIDKHDAPIPLINAMIEFISGENRTAIDLCNDPVYSSENKAAALVLKAIAIRDSEEGNNQNVLYINCLIEARQLLIELQIYGYDKYRIAGYQDRLKWHKYYFYQSIDLLLSKAIEQQLKILHEKYEQYEKSDDKLISIGLEKNRLKRRISKYYDLLWLISGSYDYVNIYRKFGPNLSLLIDSDIYEDTQNSVKQIQQYLSLKKEILRLIPENLRNFIFNNDGSINPENYRILKDLLVKFKRASTWVMKHNFSFFVRDAQFIWSTIIINLIENSINIEWVLVCHDLDFKQPVENFLNRAFVKRSFEDVNDEFEHYLFLHADYIFSRSSNFDQRSYLTEKSIKQIEENLFQFNTSLVRAYKLKLPLKKDLIALANQLLATTEYRLGMWFEANATLFNSYKKDSYKRIFNSAKKGYIPAIVKISALDKINGNYFRSFLWSMCSATDREAANKIMAEHIQIMEAKFGKDWGTWNETKLCNCLPKYCQSLFEKNKLTTDDLGPRFIHSFFTLYDNEDIGFRMYNLPISSINIKEAVFANLDADNIFESVIYLDSAANCQSKQPIVNNKPYLAIEKTQFDEKIAEDKPIDMLLPPRNLAREQMLVTSEEPSAPPEEVAAVSIDEGLSLPISQVGNLPPERQPEHVLNEDLEGYNSSQSLETEDEPLSELDSTTVFCNFDNEPNKSYSEINVTIPMSALAPLPPSENPQQQQSAALSRASTPSQFAAPAQLDNGSNELPLALESCDDHKSLSNKAVSASILTNSMSKIFTVNTEKTQTMEPSGKRPYQVETLRKRSKKKSSKVEGKRLVIF